MPPSEYRKPPSNAWTSPSEHRESTFLRLPAHPSAYSHILPSQAESSNRGGELLSLSRYPFPIPTAYFQHSAQLHELLVNRRGMICALCGTSMKTLMALHCKGWKKNTDTKGLTRRSKERSSRRSMKLCFFFFARVSSLIRRLTSPRTQDGTLGGLHTAAERIQPAEQEQRPGEGGGVRGGVLARGEGGAGVLPLRREVLLDRPASELADCGRPHASRGAALLEQGGPFRGGGGGWGDRDCRY